MRPINRGDWPLGADGGPVNYIEYGEARPELIRRIGSYCSYCEIRLPYIHVEHMQPQGIVIGVQLNWYNFLLGCPSCNSVKGHRYRNVNDYYWPDTHNTHLLFDFLPGGIVVNKQMYPQGISVQKALKTLKLTGLDRYAHTTTDDDRRWIERFEAEGKAKIALSYYENNGYPVDYIPCLVDTATGSGFWSVWMVIFKDHPEVQDALVDGFRGTFTYCRTTNINRL